MNNEEKFKDNLKSKLESKEFEFDEANWDKASKLIDENRKKRSLWPYFLMLGMLIGSLFTYFILNNEKPVISQTIMAKQDAVNPVTEPSQNTIPKKSVSQIKTSFKKAQPIAPKTTVVHAKVNSPKFIQTYSPLPGNETKIITTTETSAVSHTQDNQSTSTVEKSDVPPVVSTKEPIFKNEEPANTITTKQNVETVIPNAGIAVIADETANKNPENSRENVTETKLNQKESEVIETQLAVVNPSTSPIVPTENVATSIDSNKISNSSPATPLKSPLISLEAGASYLFGWKNNGIKEAQGFNPVIGINYHNKLTNDFDYSLGIQFSAIGHLSSFSDTSKVTHYKYGEESDVTIITPQTLYYLSLPFRVSKTCHMNTIGLNANLAYLLTSNSKVETYHQSVDMTNQNTTTATGYTQGFANYNFELGAFYRRRLYKNLYINTEIAFGLTDLKNNSFFQNSGVERSSGIKVSLIYGLITR